MINNNRQWLIRNIRQHASLISRSCFQSVNNSTLSFSDLPASERDHVESTRFVAPKKIYSAPDLGNKDYREVNVFKLRRRRRLSLQSLTHEVGIESMTRKLDEPTLDTTGLPQIDDDFLKDEAIGLSVNRSEGVFFSGGYLEDRVKEVEVFTGSGEKSLLPEKILSNEIMIDSVKKQRFRKEHETMRLAKRIAKSGKASRREAEKLISEGRIKVNDIKVTSPAMNVTTKDRIRIDGKELSTNIELPRLWLMHKPKAELVSRTDPKNRPCLLQRMPDVGLSDTLKPIGRLDYMTEGLVLLTNDGDLARKLEHPSVGLRREYRVRVFGSVTSAKIRAMQKGCMIDGVKYRGMGVFLDRGEGNNTWLTVLCTEGKNNQIRRVCKHMNLTVNRLIRTSFGPFKLGKIAPGGITETKLEEYFVDEVNNAMESGKPVRTKNYNPVNRSYVGARRQRGVASKKLAANTKSQSIRPKIKVKRGRGGGISVRKPNESSHNEVQKLRLRKKKNKILAWKVKYEAKRSRKRSKSLKK